MPMWRARGFPRAKQPQGYKQATGTIARFRSDICIVQYTPRTNQQHHHSRDRECREQTGLSRRSEWKSAAATIAPGSSTSAAAVSNHGLLSLIFASVGLSRLLRGLALPPEPPLREEVDRARDEASTAGIDAIDKARHQLSHRVDEADINANAAARVIGFYRSRLDGAAAGGVDAQKSRKAEQVERALRLAGLRAEREKIFEMARHSQMSHETSRKLVREIDLMEARYR